MKVLLYTEGYKALSKSGLGKAIKHQVKALEDNHIPYTTNLKDDFDIMHVNYYGPKSYFLTKKMRKKGKKIIYHAHSTEEDFRNSFKFSNLVAPLFKKWLCTCYKLGDIIITPTEYSKKLLESYNLERPIKAISNGVDTTFFERDVKAGQAFRKEYGYSKKDKVIVGIGLYIERKGIIDFVELAKRLPEYKFIWFGYSPLWLSPRKIKKAVSTKLDNLTFAGYVDSSMIKSALSGANLYLFPTFEETEGIPIIEALSSKIPTLIRDIPIFEEYPKNKVVYKASNLEEFEIMIKKIINKEVPDLTEAGYKLARKKDLHIIGKQLADTYCEVMEIKRKSKDPVNKIKYFRSLGIVLVTILLCITMLIKFRNFEDFADIKAYRERSKETNELYSENLEYMNAKIDVKLYASESSLAKKALNEIDSIYKEYDVLTDRNNKESELYKINHNNLKDDKLTIDVKLYNLINYGLDWYDKSNGYININTGALTELWEKSLKEQKRVPTEKELNNVNIDIDTIELLDNNQIKNNHPNIDLDNLRLGYATARVIDTLSILKIDKYIITAGSNIVVGDYYKDNGKYNIVISSPFKNNDAALATLNLTNKAISSKNLYQKYYTVSNKDYGMIINPKTKQPVDELVGVSVVGNKIDDVEAMTTMLYMMSIEDGQTIVNNDDSVEAIWAYSYDGIDDYVISDNFYQS